ncbi:MAG: LysM peptidoglycan-binding domain-containing protein [Methylobacter sp.]|jgi:membrane-bound lytic murein transglycosylase D
MHVNFNRSVRFLLLPISLIATGCSQTSKDSLSINDQPPTSSYQDNSYAKHSLPNRKFNTALAYKNTVWGRLLSLYSLPEIKNERIDRQVNWYLQHPATLAIIQERAEPYLHLILDEVEAKNIPGELALLPVVESAFLPEAYSKSDASGLWQFIPETGRLYGLKQNEWYDGRRDIYASTKAATAFLKNLNETFNGDWLLALASYNYGKGNVQKSIERNEDLHLPTDYWSLSLPEETANYVPRLLAIARIFANAEKYNVHLQHIPNKPYCEVVDVKSQLDLNKAAQLANTPLSEFLRLNPGFNRSSTAPDGPHHLLIPVTQVQTFKENLAELPYEDRVDLKRYHEETRHNEVQATVSTRQYKVKQGESLAAIAAKNKTTVKAIQMANHLKGTATSAGMTLKIPGAKKADDTIFTAKASQNNAGNTQVYVVKKGDTFFNIGQRFSVSGETIAEWNKTNSKSALVLGQKLVIKAGNKQQQTMIASSAKESAAQRSISYTVKQGDSLAQISRKFNVSIADLRKWNSPEVAKSLTPGKKLKVIVKAT